MSAWLIAVTRLATTRAVRAVAAIPALGLLAGVAFGLLDPGFPPAVSYVLLSMCVGTALFTP
ncbi:MAG: hypothetical protein A3G76_10535 [Acidobacteria bacterium RIFCSPLOWO2_12_FULL_65_11]|nr:MAG: hypothetical protein A3H95_08350 [Acidobacteria bacterium RIFCSPLOWO2_02_FULL_64_15]OFW30487.1 MAG: hypothetical protein A3G76_10535 [Acidobacteria bacterium RIFCSPLOWO2_12_FULL_65_11]